MESTEDNPPHMPEGGVASITSAAPGTACDEKLIPEGGAPEGNEEEIRYCTCDDGDDDTQENGEANSLVNESQTEPQIAETAVPTTTGQTTGADTQLSGISAFTETTSVIPTSSILPTFTTESLDPTTTGHITGEQIQSSSIPLFTENSLGEIQSSGVPLFTENSSVFLTSTESLDPVIAGPTTGDETKFSDIPSFIDIPSVITTFNAPTESLHPTIAGETTGDILKFIENPSVISTSTENLDPTITGQTTDILSFIENPSVLPTPNESLSPFTTSIENPLDGTSETVHPKSVVQGGNYKTIDDQIVSDVGESKQLGVGETRTSSSAAEKAEAVDPHVLVQSENVSSESAAVNNLEDLGLPATAVKSYPAIESNSSAEPDTASNQQTLESLVVPNPEDVKADQPGAQTLTSAVTDVVDQVDPENKHLGGIDFQKQVVSQETNSETTIPSISLPVKQSPTESDQSGDMPTVPTVEQSETKPPVPTPPGSEPVSTPPSDPSVYSACAVNEQAPNAATLDTSSDKDLDFLKCKFCKEVFEQPVILPCSHIFCRTRCASKFFTGFEVCCFLCQNKSFVEGGHLNLPVAITFHTMIQKLQFTGKMPASNYTVGGRTLVYPEITNIEANIDEKTKSTDEQQEKSEIPTEKTVTSTLELPLAPETTNNSDINTDKGDVLKEPQDSAVDTIATTVPASVTPKETETAPLSMKMNLSTEAKVNVEHSMAKVKTAASDELPPGTEDVTLTSDNSAIKTDKGNVLAEPQDSTVDMIGEDATVPAPITPKEAGTPPVFIKMNLSKESKAKVEHSMAEMKTAESTASDEVPPGTEDDTLPPGTEDDEAPPGIEKLPGRKPEVTPVSKPNTSSSSDAQPITQIVNRGRGPSYSSENSGQYDDQNNQSWNNNWNNWQQPGTQGPPSGQWNSGSNYGGWPPYGGFWPGQTGYNNPPPPKTPSLKEQAQQYAQQYTQWQQNYNPNYNQTQNTYGQHNQYNQGYQQNYYNQGYNQQGNWYGNWSQAQQQQSQPQQQNYQYGYGGQSSYTNTTAPSFLNSNSSTNNSVTPSATASKYPNVISVPITTAKAVENIPLPPPTPVEPPPLPEEKVAPLPQSPPPPLPKSPPPPERRVEVKPKEKRAIPINLSKEEIAAQLLRRARKKNTPEPLEEPEPKKPKIEIEAGGGLPDEAPQRHVCISNLPGGTKAAALRDALSDYGRIVTCKIAAGKGKNPGIFAFVTIETLTDSNALVATLNDMEFSGIKLKVKKLKALPGAKS